MLVQKAYDTVLSNLDYIHSGTLTLTTPDGRTRVFQGQKEGQRAALEIRDWRVLTGMMKKGDIAFAESYRAGAWETDNLAGLVELGLLNRNAFDKFVVGKKSARFIAMVSYLLRLNTINGSKKNIHAHYDLGNEFYKLWLDPTMTYSSAIFKNDSDDLAKAQHNKYDRILNCLNTKSGNIIEVGCGWGGFADRALQKGDFNIKGITLSEEQHDYARKRVDNKANIALEDYRNQSGKFDHIVSIEMFEAVGERYWRTYFDKIAHLLDQKGKAVIQTITMNEEDFPRYRRGGDFIRSFIFPGGMLPSPTRFREEAAKSGLRTHNEYYFGQDYARTLEIWLEAFESKTDDVKAQGFDDGFIRLWRLYLAACIAGFKTKRTNVMQVELSHA